MSKTVRSAGVVIVYVIALLLVPGAYTVSDESSPSAEPSASPSPSPTPTESASPDPTPDPTPSETPTSEPSPTPQPDGDTEKDEPPSESEAVGVQPTLALNLAPDSVAPGEPTTLSMVVSNPGAVEVEGLDVNVLLPSGLTYQSSNPPADGVEGRPSGTSVTFLSLNVPAAGSISADVVAEPEMNAKKPLTIEASAVWTDGQTSATATLEVETADAALELSSSGGGFLQAVGGQIEYQITVKNVSQNPAQEISLVNLVPGEVHVLSAGIAPGVDAVQVGHHEGKEDVVWVIDKLNPNKSVRVTYTGVVERAGDLEALNRTRTLSSNAARTETQDRTYLADSGGGGSNNTSFDPIREKRVTREKVVERPLIRKRVSTDPSAPGSSADLPFTGIDPWATTAFGMVLLVFGVVLVHVGSGKSDRRRVGGASVILLLVAGACMSNNGDIEPEVLGTQITRSPDTPATEAPPTEAPPTEDPGSNPGDGPTDPNDGTGPTDPGNDGSGGNGSPGAGDGTGSNGSGNGSAGGPDTTVVLVPGDPVTTFERNVDFVTVTAGDLPVHQLGSAQGSNTTFAWDDSASAITQAASSNSIVEGVAELSAQVVPQGRGMRLTVTLTNVAEQTRLGLRGNLAVEISTGGGGGRVLESGAVDLVLNPQGQTTAEFAFRLPSGAYGARALFQSS